MTVRQEQRLYLVSRLSVNLLDLREFFCCDEACALVSLSNPHRMRQASRSRELCKRTSHGTGFDRIFVELSSRYVLDTSDRDITASWSDNCVWRTLSMESETTGSSLRGRRSLQCSAREAPPNFPPSSPQAYFARAVMFSRRVLASCRAIPKGGLGLVCVASGSHVLRHHSAPSASCCTSARYGC